MMLAPIQLGATIVYMARFSPLGAVNAIREHGISIVMGVPSMYGAMLHLKERDARRLQDDLRDDQRRRAAARGAARGVRGSGSACRCTKAYGMTETSLAIAMNTPQTHKPGSVGMPVPRIQLKIVDDDGDGRAHRSPRRDLAQGSDDHEAAITTCPTRPSAAFTRDGFFKHGRPRQVRRRRLPAHHGTQEGPDYRRRREGLAARDRGGADVAPGGCRGRGCRQAATRCAAKSWWRSSSSARDRRPRLTSCASTAAAQGLAQWKVPREVHVVPDLPRSPTGKVLKRALVQ